MRSTASQSLTASSSRPARFFFPFAGDGPGFRARTRRRGTELEPDELGEEGIEEVEGEGNGEVEVEARG